MTYDPHLHHRSSIRLEGRDYSYHGAYFVTICTQNKECILGQIHDGIFCPNAWGIIVDECWRAVPDHFKIARLDEFAIMPNHFHAILWLLSEDELPQPIATRRASLATILGSFKSAVTRAINSSTGNRGAIVWQRNYFEHIIRDDDALCAIRQYVQENPSRWHHDADNASGDRADSLQKFLTHANANRRGEALPRPAQSSPNPPRSPSRTPAQTGRGMPRPYGNHGNHQ